MSKKKQPVPTEPPEAEPDGFANRLFEYAEWMRATHYSAETIAQAEYSITGFAAWCRERGHGRPVEVTRTILEGYARHLYRLRRPSGRPLAFRTQHVYLCAIRGFFRFLARRNFVLLDPASDLELPKLAHRIPRNVLTHEEVERVLAQPDITTAPGLRDRALFEMLYSTGLRRRELTRLLVSDLDVERRTVFVREGKNNKDRLVPIGERALEWNERYLRDVRPGLVRDLDNGFFFLTEYGKRLSEDGLSHRVTRYVQAAGIEKAGSCHLFRHTTATLMLEGGADIRALQEILGHTKLETTQLYTHVSIGHLKAVHDRTHPSAKRPESPETEEEKDDEREPETD